MCICFTVWLLITGYKVISYIISRGEIRKYENMLHIYIRLAINTITFSQILPMELLTSGIIIRK